MWGASATEALTRIRSFKTGQVGSAARIGLEGVSLLFRQGGSLDGSHFIFCAKRCRFAREAFSNRRARLLSGLILASVLGTSPGRAQHAALYRLQPVAGAPAGLAEAFANALDPQGVALVTENGETIGELWLRREVPLQADAAGSDYGALAEGTLVGTLRFPKGGSDFRGQPIPAGVYTLRSARIPEDGNHLGAAPESHFLLLCPAAADRDLGAAFDFQSVVALSRKAAGTEHPAPLMLLRPKEQTEGQTEFPAIQQGESGTVAIRMKTRGKPAGSAGVRDFPLALVLIGKTEL